LQTVLNTAPDVFAQGLHGRRAGGERDAAVGGWGRSRSHEMNLLEVKCPGPETSSGPLEVHRTALARDKAAPSTGRTADGMLRPVVRITRRRLLVGAAAGVAAGAGYAFGLEPRWLEVREWLVPVVGLPRSLAGYRIAQVTDAHLASLGLVEEAIVRAVR